jgi:hypothetical protein
MAGLNNNSNPFQNQVRIGPQYIQLVPGSPGPAGNGALTIQSNNGAIIQRGTLDLVGFTYTDDAGNNRMIFAVPVGLGAPVAAAASHTMQPGEQWALVQPDEVMTMPVAPVVGLTYEFITSGSGFGGGHPVIFQGNGSNMQNPQDPNNIFGGRAPASSVPGTQENTNYKFRYDGTIYRCV